MGCGSNGGCCCAKSPIAVTMMPQSRQGNACGSMSIGSSRRSRTERCDTESEGINLRGANIGHYFMEQEMQDTKVDKTIFAIGTTKDVEGDSYVQAWRTEGGRWKR